MTAETQVPISVELAAPDGWTVDVARAGISLYWAMYYADPDFIINAPESVARAYMRCQEVMGP